MPDKVKDEPSSSPSSEKSSVEDATEKRNPGRGNNGNSSLQSEKGPGKGREESKSKATRGSNTSNDDVGEGTETTRSKRPRRSTQPVTYACSSGSGDDASVSSEEMIENQSNNDDFDDDLEDVVENSPRKKRPRKKAKTENDMNKSDVDEVKPPKRQKGGEKSSATKEKKTFKCPHCEKPFKTPNGLKYHIDKKVCRQVEATPTKKQGKGQPRKKADTVLETDEDLTCPHCKRVFKSMEGMKYHVEKKVCRKASLIYTKDGKAHPFPTLKPGQRFVTPFGVVEVVKDDRAVPTAILPNDIQDQYRKYQKSRNAIDVRDRRRHIKIAGKLRVRRNAINSLYEKGKANRRSIFDAYFGADPEHMRSVIKANSALAGAASSSSTQRNSDPKEPEDSFPDRIVECIWITDQRSHNLDPENTIVKRDAEQGPKKVYLQRKLLAEPYDKTDTVYYCPDCGKKFETFHARRFHCERKKCAQEARMKKGRLDGLELKIEREMEDNMKFPERRKFIRNKTPSSMINKDGTRRKWKKKKKAESSVYPEVVLAMGFKLVRKQKNNSNDIILSKPGRELSNIIDDLKGTFRIHQRRTSDQRHGSIYAEVYKALGFKFPGKRKGTDVGNNVSARKRRKRVVKPKPPPPPKPLPPAIDVGALADEIKSGRYPSFKVFEGEHADDCVLCRKGGKMYCCEFCNNVEHFKCILTKFTIKEPEPDEDFMCHKCIGIILSRRARAEKRRLRKQAKNETLKKEEAMTESDPSDEKEYPYMASQAREVNELVELLKDSQVRLRRSIETTKINNIRRQVIAGVYPDGYSAPY